MTKGMRLTMQTSRCTGKGAAIETVWWSSPVLSAPMNETIGNHRLNEVTS